MGDTAYGRLVELKKKELTASLGKSTKKERNEWREKIYLMDTSNAGEDGDKGEE